MEGSQIEAGKGPESSALEGGKGEGRYRPYLFMPLLGRCHSTKFDLEGYHSARDDVAGMTVEAFGVAGATTEFFGVPRVHGASQATARNPPWCGYNPCSATRPVFHINGARATLHGAFFSLTGLGKNNSVTEFNKETPGARNTRSCFSTHPSLFR